MSGVGGRIRIGKIQRLWAYEFSSLVSIGLAIGALALTGAGHGGTQPPVGDMVVALVVAGSLIGAGAVGAWRCWHLEIELFQVEVRVRGIWRNWRLPLADIAFIGYGPTLLARSLYLITSDGKAVMARGVSYQGRTAPPEANEVVGTIRAVAEAAGSDPGRWAPDPVPNLPDLALEPSDRPPPGTSAESIQLAPLWRANFKSLALAEVVAVLVAIGVQACFPGTFPWIVLVVIGVLAAYSVFTAWFTHRVFRRISASVAYSGNVIAVGASGKWRAIDLTRLAGVGAEWMASSPGISASTLVITKLRFVDLDGHRLVYDGPILPQALLQAVRGHLNDTVQVTPLAEQVLHSRHQPSRDQRQRGSPDRKDETT